MQLNNIGGYRTITEYIDNKISRYRNEPVKDFKVMFSYMFSDDNIVMAEHSDGYRINKTTYGECKQKIITVASAFSNALQDIPKGSKVGLCAANSLKWIQAFWAILMCGHSPIFFNSRLPKEALEEVIAEHNVVAVISDGAVFSAKTFDLGDLFNKDDGTPFTPTVWGDRVMFMSSGSTGKVKLCAYTGENFFYQICDSVDIITNCPQMVKGYDGELKHLVLLPLYHVFGFIAVYVWFTFFARTMVFLKDLNPQTVQNTIRKHKVTHFFAVPMVWEGIYKKTLQAIRNKGEKQLEKFRKAVHNSANDKLTRNAIIKSSAFSEIREKLFGDSIRFLISGGSAVSAEVLEFYNGLGYHMANGFGMTEVGITSVDISMKSKVLCGGSIGFPFNHTEYSVSEKGELLIRGKTMASEIYTGEKCLKTDFNEWFNTNDLIEKRGDRYYHHGRRDDLVVCSNGENLNPELLETRLLTENVKAVCLISSKGAPVLIASIEKCFSADKLKSIHDRLKDKLRENNLQDEVKKLVITTNDLLTEGQIKISRKKVAERYERGQLSITDYNDAERFVQENLSELERELRECFAELLEKPVEQISTESDFFTDLGGTSLDYFTLLGEIKNKYGLDVTSPGERLSTIKAFYEYIKTHS